MALDRLSQVTSSGLASPINIGIATLTSTVVGSAVTINSSGIDVAGIVTATTANFVNATISGDLTVEGTTTTLDTILTEVDKLEVGANNTTVGVAITQSGSGDILNLYDGSSEVFSVADGGAVTTSGDISVGGDLTLPDAIVHSGDTDTKIRFPATDTFTVETAGEERLRINSSGKVGIGTDNPSTNLHVVGSVRATGAFDLRDTAGNVVLFVEDASNDARISNQTAGEDIVIRTTPSGGSATERLRISSGGDLFVAGTGGMNTTQLNNGNTVNINGTSSNDGFSVIRYSTGYGAYGLNIGRSKSDTLGTNTAVTNGNDLGHITFYGADGTDFNEAAQITAQVDGTPSDGTDMPGRLVFKTSSDASATPTEKLRIRSDGDVVIGTSDLESQLGSRRRLAVCDTTNGALLHLRGQSPAIFFDQSGGNIGKIFLDDVDFAIQPGTPATEGTERLRITSTGNVGIGVTNPQQKLHVVGNSLVTGYSKVGGWVTKTWSLASPPNGTSVQHIIHSTTANNIQFIHGELIILPSRSGLNQQRGYVKYAISYSFYQGALYGFITELERTGVLGFSNLTLTSGVVSGTTANIYINATSNTAALGSIFVKFEGNLYGY